MRCGHRKMMHGKLFRLKVNSYIAIFDQKIYVIGEVFIRSCLDVIGKGYCLPISIIYDGPYSTRGTRADNVYATGIK